MEQDILFTDKQLVELIRKYTTEPYQIKMLYEYIVDQLLETFPLQKKSKVVYEDNTFFVKDTNPSKVIFIQWNENLGLVDNLFFRMCEDIANLIQGKWYCFYYHSYQSYLIQNFDPMIAMSEIQKNYIIQQFLNAYSGLFLLENVLKEWIDQIFLVTNLVVVKDKNLVYINESAKETFQMNISWNEFYNLFNGFIKEIHFRNFITLIQQHFLLTQHKYFMMLEQNNVCQFLNTWQFTQNKEDDILYNNISRLGYCFHYFYMYYLSIYFSSKRLCIKKHYSNFQSFFMQLITLDQMIREEEPLASNITLEMKWYYQQMFHFNCNLYYLVLMMLIVYLQSGYNFYMDDLIKMETKENEIVTTYIHLSNEMQCNLDKIYDYYIINLPIYLDQSGHQNILIIDTRQNTITRFEPFGSFMNPAMQNALNRDLSNYFENVYLFRGNKLKYLPPESLCLNTQFIGPQQVENILPNDHNIRNFCITLSNYFIGFLIKHPDNVTLAMLEYLENVFKNPKNFENQIKSFLNQYYQFVKEIMIYINDVFYTTLDVEKYHIYLRNPVSVQCGQYIYQEAINNPYIPVLLNYNGVLMTTIYKNLKRKKEIILYQPYKGVEIQEATIPVLVPEPVVDQEVVKELMEVVPSYKKGSIEKIISEIESEEVMDIVEEPMEIEQLVPNANSMIQ